MFCSRTIITLSALLGFLSVNGDQIYAQGGSPSKNVTATTERAKVAGSSKTSLKSPLINARSERYPDGNKLNKTYSQNLSALTKELRGENVFSFFARPASYSLVAPVIAPNLRDLAKAVLPNSRLSVRNVISTYVMGEALKGNDKEGSSTPSHVDKTIILYELSYDNIPLAAGSDAMAIISKSNEVLTLRQRNLPKEIDSTVPRITRTAALNFAKQHFVTQSKISPGGPEIDLGDANSILTIYVDPETLKGHLAWAFNLSSTTSNDPQGIRYWVSASEENKIINVENKLFHGGEVKADGEVWKTSSASPVIKYPLGYLRVVAPDGSTINTGPTGSFTFPGDGPERLNARLDGPYSSIQDKSIRVMEREIKRTGKIYPPLSFVSNNRATREFELAQVTAFLWANASHEFVINVLNPGSQGLLNDLPTIVNHNEVCNAYWNGASINFFKAGQLAGRNCLNTAYSDVIIHEYGHAVDDRFGAIIDGAYSEGFGDALAILMTRQPCIGRDFDGRNTCMRRATEIVNWPPSAGEVHEDGKIYSGFVWELIQQLSKRYSADDSYRVATALILGAAAANPADIQDAVELSFKVDDTDGDLSNGSPHFTELAAAADSRRISHPSKR